MLKSPFGHDSLGKYNANFSICFLSKSDLVSLFNKPRYTSAKNNLKKKRSLTVTLFPDACGPINTTTDDISISMSCMPAKFVILIFSFTTKKPFQWLLNNLFMIKTQKVI